MKQIVILILIGFLLLSCENKDNKTEENRTASEIRTPLEGAWELVGYYNYADNVVTDSFDTSEGYRQVKMYTPSRVMWSKSIPSDSSEWFGYGRYNLDGNQMVEVLDYGSEMMSKIIQEKKEFKYELIIKDNYFSQIEMDENGNKIYAENYKRIE